MRKFKIEKKYIPALVLVVACIVVGVLCAIKAVEEIKYNEFLNESSLMDLTQTNIIADGGNGTEIPKNTVYAVDDLISKQFTSVKIDARLTKDKKWVSLQSEDISSVTNGKGKVGDYSYFDLLNFNIKNFRPREFPVIELVSETAKYAYQNSIYPIVFLHDYSKSATKNLIGTFDSEGIQVSAFASDDMRVLKYIRKLKTDVNLIYYVDVVTDEDIEECRKDGNISVCFNSENRKSISVQIEKMTSEQVNFLCYGVENLKDIEELYKLGVRRFVTDTVKVN